MPPSSPARGKPQTRNCRNPRRGPGIPGKGRFFPVAPGAVALAIVVTVTVPVESSVPLGVTEPGETLQAASRGAPEQVARTCVLQVRGISKGRAADLKGGGSRLNSFFALQPRENLLTCCRAPELLQNRLLFDR